MLKCNNLQLEFYTALERSVESWAPRLDNAHKHSQLIKCDRQSLLMECKAEKE